MKTRALFFIYILMFVLTQAQTTRKNYIGTWKNEKMEFELKGDGTTVLAGNPATWTLQNGLITYDFGGGVLLTYKVTVKGNTLTSTGFGITEVYQRVTGASGNSKISTQGKSGGKEISGKWCKFTGSSNNSYASQTYLTLFNNGTYEYTSESSTSGSNGSTAGQGYDTGTWTYDGTTLHLSSRSQGPIQYTCIKSYHNKDAALIIGGTEFVAWENRGGW